jgi:repressor LexA
MKKVDKKEELLNFIKKYVDDNGYPPTVREMCRAVKVNSTSTIAYHLARLEDEGSIKKNPNKNRALEVVDNFTTKFAKVITSNDTAGLTSIPMLGVITAGEPILAVENCEEYFMVSPNLFRGDGLFMLTVKGESMINAGIFDGDQIIVRQQTYADNGEIVAVGNYKMGEYYAVGAFSGDFSAKVIEIVYNTNRTMVRFELDKDCDGYFVHNPETMPNDFLKIYQEVHNYYNAQGDRARMYPMKKHDVFSVSVDAFGGVEPAVGATVSWDDTNGYSAA